VRVPESLARLAHVANPEILMARQSARAATTALPVSMKAGAIDRFGPPSALRLHTVPVPRPGPRDILIALHTAGVGDWDASMRDGSWKPAGRTRFPLVLGTDGAGIVVGTGSRVRRFGIGDRVYAYAAGNAKGGFYAQYVAVDERAAAPVPARLDLAEAGGGAVTGLTALQGIDTVLAVRKGETVLVFGASGAVGTLAVQFARRRGCRVLATASGPSASRLVRRLGAEAVIDARSASAADRLRELAPDGIDAVLALAGGRELERCLDLVRAGGRVAHPNGIEPAPARRRRFRVRAYDVVAGPREFAQLGRAVDVARLRVPIAAQYPLAAAADAHRRLDRHAAGRIVIRIRRRLPGASRPQPRRT
jgi:NADPH:quinone reductase-like Zn-dependent oxidoreductase